ncbi:MAG: hypothetical protein Q7R22_018155 [Verrucomicrobiota bacterium JB025]|nr:hypothetical protein [Verrucomicrobiota bacterium JB025]
MTPSDLWIRSDEFRAGSAMTASEMKYQHRGYGKYTEIAGLFGWDALGDFWNSVAVDYENGIEYSRNSDPADSRILRMSRAAGCDLRPLIHFWGVHPVDADGLAADMEAEGLAASAAIYDRLVYYQSIIPQTVSAFEAHYQLVKNAPIDSDFFDTMRTGWNSSYAGVSHDKVQEIIDLYFPDGRPIASLPHFEGFEDGIGDWAQATDDDFEWRRQSGGTFTASAGPDGASSGDHYMVAEGHDAGGSNKTASLQCTFDFSARRETTLAFDYHMYGSYIDYLAVDIHDGSGWTNNVWIMNGQQHGSSSDAWSTATVDLTEFSGNDEVTVRFRTRNGEWNSADPAIDNVSIEVGAIELPYAESFESGFGAWSQSADDDFDWTRYSGETPTGSTGPSGASDGDWYLYIEGNDYHNLHNKVAQLECVFDFSRVRGAELSFDYHMYGTNIDYLAVDVFDGSSWATDVWRKDGAQNAGSEDPWSTAVVDLSDYAGSDEVTVRFRAKEKYWHVSDIAIDNVVVEETPPELPYAESFEDGWGIWVQSADDDLDWTRHSGGTDTGNTGPSGAADGDWYLYVENHDDGAYYKTAQVDFTLDFSAAVSPELTFDYHMYGFYIDYLSVDVHDGVSWTTDVWQQVGQAQSSSDDPWLSAAVDLSAFAGIDEVTIRFRSKQKQWHAADTAIDHIRVAEAEVLVETAYELWSGTVFAEAPEGTDAAVSGNPDGDRFTNLQEWALVLDPLVADAPALQVSMDDADGFTVTYSRRTSDEVTVHAAWSSALDSTDWRVAGDGMTETVVGSDGDVETVFATVPFDANQKFIRLEIEE